MIVWNELAEKELKDAYTWYELQRSGLGDSLVLCIDASLAGLLRHPFLGTPIAGDVRRILVKKFPYGLYYRVKDTDIEVIGFRHFMQKPLYEIQKHSPKTR
jgi:plasmid stabilization system protein ParE